ncbi:MAG: hypothetical protein R6U19_06860 [Bacteroidales bacterium]
MITINDKVKSLLFWVFAILFTMGIAAYQRATGPTYPVSGESHIMGETIHYRLLRSHNTGSNAPVVIPAPENENTEGFFIYRRYQSHDQWDTIAMERSNDTLRAEIPKQPPAGKVQYNVILKTTDKLTPLEETPVILRYKGKVPALFLIPHIILMFLAMLFSTRAGLEALIKGKNTYLYTILTLITLIGGGLILGPVIQKYAFGQYWTGWPVSNDLTDNKTLIIFIFWAIAFMVQRKNKKRKAWTIVASAMLIAVYLIPHSVMGSEIDWKEQQAAEKEKNQQIQT